MWVTGLTRCNAGNWRGGMRAAARRIRGRWCPGEWCAGRDRDASAVGGRRRKFVSPFGHSGALLALNRHFRRHFVLVCARNSAISRSGLSPDENDPGERAGRSPARLGTGTAALYHSTPAAPPPSPGPRGPVTPAPSSLNIPHSSLKTALIPCTAQDEGCGPHSSDLPRPLTRQRALAG